MNIEHQYLNILRELLKISENEKPKDDRTGTGTYSTTGVCLVANDIQNEFPVLTTKKVWFYGIVAELLWFLRGETNIKSLQKKGVHIWDEWADENGEIGRMYGYQWRNWEDIREIDEKELEKYLPYYQVIGKCNGKVFIKTVYDQISNVIDILKNEPNSRRAVVSAWNVSAIPFRKLSFEENIAIGRGALAPCHAMFQFVHNGNGMLDIIVFQRSADIFLGVPFNLASYALLLSIIAKIVNMTPRKLVWFGGDVHLYSNHVEQAKTQLARKPKKLPKLKFKKNFDSIDEVIQMDENDFCLVEYDPHPAIKAPISV